MSINKKVKECPKDKNIKPKSKNCEECEFYQTKKWFSYGGNEVDAFCTFDMNGIENTYIKGGKVDKKDWPPIEEPKKDK